MGSWCFLGGEHEFVLQSCEVANLYGEFILELPAFNSRCMAFDEVRSISLGMLAKSRGCWMVIAFARELRM